MSALSVAAAGLHWHVCQLTVSQRKPLGNILLVLKLTVGVTPLTSSILWAAVLIEKLTLFVFSGHGSPAAAIKLISLKPLPASTSLVWLAKEQVGNSFSLQSHFHILVFEKFRCDKICTEHFQTF